MKQFRCALIATSAARRRPALTPAPTGTTRVAAVIGSPVRHSLSPVIHNAGFAALGLDWTYLAFDVAPGDAVAALVAMRTLRIGGLSVTMPHKAEVALAVDRLSADARALQAVNCVAWDKGELVGHNTDGGGFVDSLAGVTELAGRSCFVAGAGGAARAVIHALGQAGVSSVIVHNRTTAKAEAATELAPDVARVGRAGEAKEADIVINATSLGMAGTPAAAAMPIDAKLLRDGHVVVDLVYHPLRTPLLSAATEAGAQVVTGVGMLAHQAARQFELWTGVGAPLEAMLDAVDAEIAHG